MPGSQAVRCALDGRSMRFVLALVQHRVCRRATEITKKKGFIVPTGGCIDRLVRCFHQEVRRTVAARCWGASNSSVRCSQQHQTLTSPILADHSVATRNRSLRPLWLVCKLCVEPKPERSAQTVRCDCTRQPSARAAARRLRDQRSPAASPRYSAQEFGVSNTFTANTTAPSGARMRWWIHCAIVSAVGLLSPSTSFSSR